MHSNIVGTSKRKKCNSIKISNDQYQLIECFLKAILQFVPNFTDYKYNDEQVLNKISSDPAKLLNASMAIQLSYDWIRKNPNKITKTSINEYLNNSDGLTLSQEIAEALMNCFYPGRCQILIQRNMTFFLDVAHTDESIKVCVDWFNSKTQSK